MNSKEGTTPLGAMVTEVKGQQGADTIAGAEEGECKKAKRWLHKVEDKRNNKIKEYDFKVTLYLPFRYIWTSNSMLASMI